jgi:Poly(hydroxyalcanoate) granule associated protein (phasin)
MKGTTKSNRKRKPAARRSVRPRPKDSTAEVARNPARGSPFLRPYEFLSAAVTPKAMTDSWQKGLRKLEEVFDERVASALARLGIPSAGALARLERKVDRLALEIQRLGGRRRKS